MKGIYYSRHCGYDNRDSNKDDWHQPAEGESIVLNRAAFSKFFPEVAIQGEIKWRCDDHSDERCEGCNGCGQSVKITFDREGQQFTASRTDEGQTHNIDQFGWGWSGSGANEHWFNDEAVCLKSLQEYRSNTGLTADSSRVVAYKRHVEVDSFRGDCKDETKTLPKQGKIWAEFVNHPGNYRANWTGFAVGSADGGNPIIGDKLDDVVEAILTDKIGEATVCRHNSNVRAHIIAPAEKIPLYLCKACRLQGIRWAEFTQRNKGDTCPYFRRACKSVTEKSDPLPEWYKWSGDNLLASYRRMKDGENEAYEVVYVRRKEGFIRRAVLLINARTREAVMYRYNGFIPGTKAEFSAKYPEGRQLLGYLGTSSTGKDADGKNIFLTEEDIKEEIAKRIKNPLWQNGKYSLLLFGLTLDIEQYAIQKGEVGEVLVISEHKDGEEWKEGEPEIKKNPSPFYADEGASYFLVYPGDWWNSRLVLRNHAGEELYRSKDSGWFLLLVAKQEKSEVNNG